MLVRGFQLAWPPLAYSIRDDDEARRAYAAVVTWFVTGCAFVVTGMWLFSRWIVRALAAPQFFDSYEAIGLIATGVTLYALYMVLVVILGRTGRTEFNFPATIAALRRQRRAQPGRWCRRSASSAPASPWSPPTSSCVALMYVFTQRLFPVPYEWGRLARVVLVSAALVGARRTAAADRGLRRPARPRRRSGAAYPLVLLLSGFFTAEERGWLARLRHPGELLAASRAPARRSPPRSTARSPRSTRPSAWTRTLAPDVSRRLSPVRRGRGGSHRGRDVAPGGRGPGRCGAGWLGEDRRGQRRGRRRTRR